MKKALKLSPYYRILSALALLTAVFLVLMLLLRDAFVANLFLGTFAIFLFSIPLHIAYQFSSKKRNLLLKILIATSVIAVGIIIVLIPLYIISQTIPDYYASNLKIPDGLRADTPVNIDLIGIKTPDSFRTNNKTNMDLELYGDGGMYYYDFRIGWTAPGTVYLKAYEITNNDPLSANSLSKERVHIQNDTDSILRFSTDNTFTIDEGDWGDYYAARFEVWFKPDSGLADQKLMEKNYIIDGWMK